MRSTEPRRGGEPLLRIDALDVFYGQAHALQGVSLALEQGVLAVVGRNGMGKSTLCKAVTGLVPAGGSVRLAGQELLGRAPDAITRLGVAYVPQGRRVWRSLTVDETLRLAAKTARQGAWTVERVYQVFPRLAERRGNGGAQLSGGEQQMLAIGRALLFNPRLLVMDEPTEGLAPVIVEQVATLLKALADERSMSVLLIEQNLGVALEVADDVAVMVNGRIAHQVPAAQLAADRALQERLLGLKAGAADAIDGTTDAPDGDSVGPAMTVLRVIRAHGPAVGLAEDRPEPLPHSAGGPAGPEPEPIAIAGAGDTPEAGIAADGPLVCLAGAWAAQPRELAQARRCLERHGLRVLAVELAASTLSPAQVGPRELLRHHPDASFFARFAGGAVPPAELALALARYLAARDDVAGFLALIREATEAVALAGAQALPDAAPRLLVGDRPLRAGAPGVLVMTAVPDAAEACLAQAAAALAGMLRAARAPSSSTLRTRAPGAPARSSFH
jgi:ABC-type branched-subunit amino acid transport system ATPase component